jgi:hypothetical protein
MERGVQRREPQDDGAAGKSGDLGPTGSYYRAPRGECRIGPLPRIIRSTSLAMARWTTCRFTDVLNL